MVGDTDKIGEPITKEELYRELKDFCECIEGTDVRGYGLLTLLERMRHSELCRMGKFVKEVNESYRANVYPIFDRICEEEKHKKELKKWVSAHSGFR